ncbi:MAG: hypothetical protein RLZZ26_502 [Candidatus Parcubacteria bacterium]|jgi:release factor glutamine methyltransferase
MNKDEQWLLDEKYRGQKTAAYEVDVKRLASGQPLAYVIGYQPFLGLKIYLDSKPLIPRPETEWWTEELITAMKKVWPAWRSPDRRPEDFLKGGDEFRFLDLCAGSGAIGCSALARLPNAHVSFGEIDSSHKPTILKNIRENKLDESRATVSIGDLFEPFGDTKFDIIAANPPYIPSGRVLEKSVTDFESPLALFSGNDGLDLIRRIAKDLPNHLAKGGVAWIEVDSAHAAAACALFIDHGLKAHVINDQYKRPRVLVVTF